MKKKIFIAAISILTLMCLVFASCDPPAGVEGGGETDVPGQGETDVPGQGETDVPGQGETDVPGQEEEIEDVVLDDADILAISYDRLENADLSFDFSIDLSAKGSELASGEGSASGRSFDQNDDGSEVYRVTYDEYCAEWGSLDSAAYDYFGEIQQQLDNLADMARKLADFAIDNITVADKVVVNGASEYILEYDSETDTVTVSERVTYGDTVLVETTKVSIYYDGDGYETVEFTRFAAGVTEEVLYTPGKYYSFIQGDKNTGMYNVNVAYNGADGWRGASYYYNLDNPYLTKEGVYDYANGMIHIDFLFEIDDVLYTYGDTMIAFRDGKETGSQVEALPSDVIVFMPSSMSSSGVSIAFTNLYMLIDLSALRGWDELCLVLDSDYELSNDFGERYLSGEGDYMAFSDGTKIEDGMLWTPEHGMLYPKYREMNGYTELEGYVDEDGNSVSLGDCSYVEIDARMYVDRAEHKTQSGWFTLGVYDNDAEKPEMSLERYELARQFFDAFGLSVYGAPDIFSDMADVHENRDIYTNEVFEYLYDRPYDAETFTAMVGEIAQRVDAYEFALDDMFDVEEKVEFVDMPQKPQNIGLVEYAKAASGSATISASGIDFTGVSVDIARSVILSEGKTYGVFVGWTNANGFAAVDAFDTAAYANEAMTFAGKGGASLPSIAAEGTYRLKAYFGKYQGGEWLRLSEVADVKVAEFEAFEIEEPTDGGYRLYRFSYDGGAAIVTVTFCDTQAPVVSFDGENVSDVVTIAAGATASDVAARFGARDNVDGDIAVSAANIAGSNGAAVNGQTPLAAGEYLLTVKDAAGNAAVVKIVAE